MPCNVWMKTGRNSRPRAKKAYADAEALYYQGRNAVRSILMPNEQTRLVARRRQLRALVNIAEWRLPRRIRVAATSHLIAQGRKLSSPRINEPIADLR